ncbi:MAG TPA: Hsp20/alpha crystallin family protein [Acholeplasmataceae bacterium]|nr:Hsp20/alpha crystallin family protein [Acholeplasmataceae bacterium]
MLSLFRRNRGFFDDFFDDFNLFSPTTSSNLMKTDIKETDKGYHLSVELPGFTKDDVKVSLEDGYLLIEAHTSKESETEDKDTKYIRKERYAGTMKRSYYVGDLKLDDIEGTFDNGILNIDIPKSATKEPEKRYLELK